MNKIEKLNDLIKIKYDYYNKLIKANPICNDIFKGFKIWYSPIIENSKILIIGINPGKNEGNINEKPILLEPSIKLEYLEGKKGYHLATSIKNAFHDAKLYSLLESNTTKTNFYHLISDNEKQLSQLNKIEKQLKNKYIEDSREIAQKIIEIVKPKYIFCEGKSSYKNVISLFPNAENTAWENDCIHSFDKNLNIHILGVSRIFSRFKNKKAVVELLKKVIK